MMHRYLQYHGIEKIPRRFGVGAVSAEDGVNPPTLSKRQAAALPQAAAFFFALALRQRG
jgi:hypothetical protein